MQSEWGSEQGHEAPVRKRGNRDTKHQTVSERENRDTKHTLGNSERENRDTKLQVECGVETLS